MAAAHHRTGSGEPLVLLHGGASCWREFEPMLPVLAAKRDVIAVKTPGHRGSPLPAPDGSLAAAEFAQLIDAELDRLGLRTVDVAGHSFGGWHALELARRGRARSVVAIAPAGGWTQQQAAEVERKFAEILIPGARHARALTPAPTRSTAGRRQLFAAAGSEGRRLTPAVAQAIVAALAEWPLAPRLHEFLAEPDGRYRTAERLSEIRCPVLLLWGSDDAIVPIAQARHFTEQLPDVELSELPGLGHFPHFDEPERVADAILSFTAR